MTSDSARTVAELIEALPAEATVLWCPACGHLVVEASHGKFSRIRDGATNCNSGGTLRREMACEALTYLGARATQESGDGA